MSETSFVKKLRRQADAVYLACEVEVAKDISDSLKLAADLLALRPEGGERWVKDAARYRKLVSQAVEGDWGCHTGWRLNVDIKGAPSIENIDDAIDAQFSLPIPPQKDRS